MTKNHSRKINVKKCRITERTPKRRRQEEKKEEESDEPDEEQSKLSKQREEPDEDRKKLDATRKKPAEKNDGGKTKKTEKKNEDAVVFDRLRISGPTEETASRVEIVGFQNGIKMHIATLTSLRCAPSKLVEFRRGVEKMWEEKREKLSKQEVVQLKMKFEG